MLRLLEGVTRSGERWTMHKREEKKWCGRREATRGRSYSARKSGGKRGCFQAAFDGKCGENKG
jgi:hypothetical protein